MKSKFTEEISAKPQNRLANYFDSKPVPFIFIHPTKYLRTIFIYILSTIAQRMHRIGNMSCMTRFAWIQTFGAALWRGKFCFNRMRLKSVKFRFVLIPNTSGVSTLWKNRCPERILDTHIYQAWKDPDSRIGFFKDACANKQQILALEREFGPVIVGEWSLATE